MKRGLQEILDEHQKQKEEQDLQNDINDDVYQMSKNFEQEMLEDNKRQESPKDDDGQNLSELERRKVDSIEPNKENKQVASIFSQ